VTLTSLSIDSIRCDGATQMRAELNSEVYLDYRDKILAGVELPPIDVYFDGTEYWLADGFHRFYGHREAKRSKVQCTVRNGTLRDAILFAVGANQDHGLKRTNEDKRNSVMTLLNDNEWVTWSNSQIVARAGVTHPFVADLRRQLETVTSSPAAQTKDEPKIGKDGKSRKARKKTSTKTSVSVTGSGLDPSASPKSLPTDGGDSQPEHGEHSASEQLELLISKSTQKLVIARWLFDSCTEAHRAQVSIAWADWWKDAG